VGQNWIHINAASTIVGVCFEGIEIFQHHRINVSVVDLQNINRFKYVLRQKGRCEPRSRNWNNHEKVIKRHLIFLSSWKQSFSAFLCKMLLIAQTIFFACVYDNSLPCSSYWEVKISKRKYVLYVKYTPVCINLQGASCVLPVAKKNMFESLYSSWVCLE